MIHNTLHDQVSAFSQTGQYYGVFKKFLPEAKEGYWVMCWACLPGSPENFHRQIVDLSL